MCHMHLLSFTEKHLVSIEVILSWCMDGFAIAISVAPFSLHSFQLSTSCSLYHRFTRWYTIYLIFITYRSEALSGSWIGSHCIYHALVVHVHTSMYVKVHQICYHHKYTKRANKKAFIFSTITTITTDMQEKIIKEVEVN